MSFCTNCGTELGGGHRFCGGCGTAVFAQSGGSLDAPNSVSPEQMTNAVRQVGTALPGAASERSTTQPVVDHRPPPPAGYVAPPQAGGVAQPVVDHRPPPPAGYVAPQQAAPAKQDRHKRIKEVAADVAVESVVETAFDWLLR
jgi:hypothetical protein